MKTDKEIYDEIFLHLSDAERELRNKNYMTAGTYYKNAMEKLYQYGNTVKTELSSLSARIKGELDERL